MADADASKPDRTQQVRVPFWAHQLAELLLGIVLLFEGARTNTHPLVVVAGVVLIVFAVVTDGPLSGWSLLSRKVHRVGDVVFALLLAASPFLLGIDETIAIVLLEVAAIVLLWLAWRSNFQTPTKKTKKTKKRAPRPAAAPAPAPAAPPAPAATPAPELATEPAPVPEPAAEPAPEPPAPKPAAAAKPAPPSARDAGRALGRLRSGGVRAAGRALGRASAERASEQQASAERASEQQASAEPAAEPKSGGNDGPEGDERSPE